MGKPAEPSTSNFWRLVFEQKSRTRKAEVNTEWQKMRMGFRAADMRGCVSMLIRFSGLTRRQIAELCGIKESYVEMMEKNGRTPATPVYLKLMTLARKYGLDEVARWFEMEAKERLNKKRPIRAREAQVAPDLSDYV